jgi:hypothetical protein
LSPRCRPSRLKEEEITTVAATTTASFFEAAFEALTAHVRKGRVRRAQRIALRSLLEMDAVRLDDLGISAHDVIEAMHPAPPAGPNLEAKRAGRARSWTNATSVAA